MKIVLKLFMMWKLVVGRVLRAIHLPNYCRAAPDPAAAPDAAAAANSVGGSPSIAVMHSAIKDVVMTTFKFFCFECI